MEKSKGSRVYRVDIPVKIDVSTIVKRLRVKPGSARLAQVAAEMAEKALAAARPKAIYLVSHARVIDRSTVAIDGVRFTSRALSKCLEGKPTAFPLIATAGQELDDLPLERGDLMRRYTLDTIKTVILFSALEYLTEYIKGKHLPGGVATLNPGEFDDFPISQQKPLFTLFGEAAGQIGVSLTSGGAIKPTKSRSGILFPMRRAF